MKIVERQGLTFIYPFLSSEGEPDQWAPSDVVIVYPEGTIKIKLDSEPVITARVARILIRALEEAVEVAEKAKTT